MATLSSVVVEFIANTAKYVQGLAAVNNSTKKWSDETKKQAAGAQQTFDGVSKSLNRLSAQILSVVAIQKISSAFINAAKSASELIDEAEKVGASANEFAVLDIAARKNGTSIEVVKNAYRELQKSINESLIGTGDAAQAFLDLGLSYTVLSNQAPTERFYAIVDALKAVEDANERSRLGNILLGKTYTELTPLIVKGSAQIRDAGKQALSTFDLQTIDRISKSFESLSVSLDVQLKKAIVDLAPAITKIVNAIQFLIDNFRLIATSAAIAFAPIVFSKFLSLIYTVSDALRAAILVQLQLIAAEAVIGGRALATMFSASTLIQIQKFSTALTALSATIAATALALSKILIVLGLVFVAFEGITRLVESAARGAGFDQYADGLAYVRESVEDFIKSILGFETASEKQKKFIEETNKKLEEARKRSIEAAEADRKMKEQMAKDAELLSFRKNLESIIKLPLPERYNELIILFNKFNNSLDPKRQEELNKAFQDTDRELENIKQTTIELLNPGEKRIKQAAILATLVRAKKITEEQAANATARYARDEAAQYDEILALRQRALDITSNSLLVDKEKEFRLKTLGQSYVDLIDPIGRVGREIQKVGALQAIKSITPEQRAALESYYQLQLKSQQVGLTGNDVLVAEQKYLETLQQINFLLPEQNENLEMQLLRVQALKNAEVQRFIEVTPLFKELVDFGKNFADGLANAIVEGQNFSDALKNVFKSILKDITVLIIRMTILQGIMAALGFVNPVAGAAFGKLVGLTTGANAAPPGRARGGPVMGGEAYRVGEAGPETFIPSSNGMILPNDFQGSGEQIIVNQTINVQTGVAQTVRAEMFGLLPRFKQEAMAGVLDAKQRGGSYAKGLAIA